MLFSAPLVLGNILQALSGTLNAIYAGRLLGVTSYAAIAVVTPILLFLSAFIAGFGSGASILAGQAWGAKDVVKLQTIAGTALFAGVALGVGLALIGVPLARQALELIGAPPETVTEALVYAQVMLGSLPLMFTAVLAAALLRGTGDSKTPLLVLSIGSTVVLILTPALILGRIGLPPMGISSAAWATSIGTLISLIWLAWDLRRRKHPLAFNLVLLRYVRPHPLLWRITKLGLPTGLFFVIGSMADVALMRIANGYGMHATAAWGIVNQVVAYVQFPGLSIAIAASIFSSQAIGRGFPEQLKTVTRTALWTSFIFSCGIALLAVTQSDGILAMFTSNEGVAMLAKRLVWIAVLGSVILGLSSVLTAVMRASGMVLWPTLISLSCLAFVLVPLGASLSQVLELPGLRMAYPITYLIGLLMHASFFNLVWKRRAVKKLI
ncbi:MAG: MATE family efflux transporter [Hydrogenophaga sp.]|nr:MATE family efflux transporter [Hydrogenophaga sp.]